MTSHKYYLTAGDGLDTSYAITWEDIFARDPADLSANTDGTLISDSPNFLGAEGCVWGTSVCKFWRLSSAMRSACRGGRVLDRGGDAGQLGVAARVGSGGAALVTRVAVRHRRPRQAGLARRGAGRGVQDTADHVDVPDAAAGGSADATGRPRSLPATIAVGAVRA